MAMNGVSGVWLVVLVALFLAIGLMLGWLIWGRRLNTALGRAHALAARNAGLETASDRENSARTAAEKERDMARAHLDALDEQLGGKRKELATLTTGLELRQTELSKARAAIAELERAFADRDRREGALKLALGHAERQISELKGASVKPSATTLARAPLFLKMPRKGGADDLRKIKGIGPKLAALCNRMGVFHFDQIAAWDAGQVQWMDDNLDGFRGRVSRDAWVGQANALVIAAARDG